MNNVGPFKMNSVAFRISREMAIAYGMVEPTPEEAEEIAANTEKFKAEQRDLRAAFLVSIEELKFHDGLSRVIFDLHAPSLTDRYMVTCPGDDFSGCEGDPPEWPCPTITALAEYHGISLPYYRLPGAEYDA